MCKNYNVFHRKQWSCVWIWYFYVLDTGKWFIKAIGKKHFSKFLQWPCSLETNNDGNSVQSPSLMKVLISGHKNTWNTKKLLYYNYFLYLFLFNYNLFIVIQLAHILNPPFETFESWIVNICLKNNRYTRIKNNPLRYFCSRWSFLSFKSIYMSIDLLFFTGIKVYSFLKRANLS